MKSIIQREKCCYLCDMEDNWNIQNLEEHHIFGGTANRKLSERYGLKVWLCRDHHTSGKDAVHRSERTMQILHELGQSAFELRHGSREAFMEIFGRNYL